MSLAKRNSEAAKAWAAKRRESKERALLQERGSSVSRRPSLSQETKPPPKHSASTSHEVNAEYMEDFRAGMATMYLALEGPSGGDREELVRRTRDRSYLGSSSEAAAGPRSSVKLSSRNPYPGEKSVHVRRRRSECKGRWGGRIETAPEMILLANEREKDTSGGSVAGWYRGPLDPAGQVSESFFYADARICNYINSSSSSNIMPLMWWVSPSSQQSSHCLFAVDVRFASRQPKAHRYVYMCAKSHPLHNRADRRWPCKNTHFRATRTCRSEAAQGCWVVRRVAAELSYYDTVHLYGPSGKT